MSAGGRPSPGRPSPWRWTRWAGIVIYGHATGEIVRLDLFGGAPGPIPGPAASERRRRGRRPAPRSAPRPAACARPTGSSPRSRPTSRPRPPSWPCSTTRPLIALFTSPHRLQVFDTDGPEAGPGAGARRASAGSSGPPPAGSPRRPTARSSSTTSARYAATARRQPGRADPPGDPPRRLRPGPGPGARPHRPADARRPLGLEAGAALAGRGPGDRSRRLRGRDDPRRRTPGLRPGRRVQRRLPLRPDRSAPADRGAQRLASRRSPGSPWPVARRSSAATTSRAGPLGASDALGGLGPLPSPAVRRGDRADGRALACDGSGELAAQSTSPGDANDVFYSDPTGIPLRISRRGVHLICSSLDGRVRWRAVVDQPLGPFAVRLPGRRRHARPVARLVPGRVETRHRDDERLPQSASTSRLM